MVNLELRVCWLASSSVKQNAQGLGTDYVFLGDGANLDLWAVYTPAFTEAVSSCLFMSYPAIKFD